jgi:hypothetical protein
MGFGLVVRATRMPYSGVLNKQDLPRPSKLLKALVYVYK